MTFYVESSAALAWLLGEPHANEIRQRLSSSDLIVSSDLTLVECDRVLTRATVTGELSEGEAAGRRAALASAAAHWTLLRIGGPVVDRARMRFPVEPVRTLDALHLASALVARAAVPDLAMLSLDEAIRDNARRLGIATQPDGLT